MIDVQHLTPDEFAEIAVIVSHLEARNAVLEAENQYLRSRVRDLEFTIGWRAENGITRTLASDGAD